jgi:hypothetical protein
MHIYKTTCLINYKVYIGMSTKDDKNYLGSGSVIKSAIKKHGKHNFKKEILEHCDTFEKLCEREIYWVDYYKNLLKDDCYNVSSGGKGGNWKMWMSEDRVEEVLSNFKKANDLKKGKHSSWNKGLKYSEEMKKKLSKAHTGKIQSKETIEKRRLKLIGKKRTQDQIKKQSAAIKDRYKEGFSEEHIKNLSDAHKGIKMSESAKEKLRKPQTKVECPHCLKIGGLPIMKRYHFDNCKNKNK